MLRLARIPVEWKAVPTAEEIRERDRERLMERLRAPAEVDEADQAFAAQLLAELGPEGVAAALVRALAADMPAPEDLLDGPAEERPNHGGFEGAGWFRINAGRRQGGDPKWLLPLICRIGHVGRSEIGAIRVAATDSYFEVSPRALPNFLKSLKKNSPAMAQDGILVEPSTSPTEHIERGGGPPRPRPSGKPKGPRPQR
jgi:ATP-dependent RNA helicase DeaD